MIERTLQLSTKIDKLNNILTDCIYSDDYIKFKDSINDFIDSGITEEPYFDITREVYRYTRAHTTINNLFFGDKSESIYFLYNEDILEQQQKEQQDLFCSLITHQDFQSKFGYDDYEAEKYDDVETTPSMQNIKKRRNLVLAYAEAFAKLYDKTNTTDLESTKKTYIDRIIDLIELRKYTYLTHNFTLIEEMVDISKVLDSNSKLSISEKFEYLGKQVQNIYKDTTITKDNLRDYIKFENEQYIRFTNYLQGKYIDRKRYFDFKNCKLPQNIMFYVELAFYLCIPSSAEIEKFLNLFGFSLKSDILLLERRTVDKKTYEITYSDLAKWIDCGVSYDLINEMLGYKLQIKVNS